MNEYCSLSFFQNLLSFNIQCKNFFLLPSFFFRTWYGKINGSSWFLLADLYNVKPTFIPRVLRSQSFLFFFISLFLPCSPTLVEANKDLFNWKARGCWPKSHIIWFVKIFAVFSLWCLAGLFYIACINF